MEASGVSSGMAGKTYWVYLLTDRSGTLYVGVTNDLERRLAEHAENARDRRDTFAGRYDLDRLVYVESYPEAADAIAREKHLKGWRRAKKVALVSAANPSWRDLRAPEADASPQAASG